MAFPLIPILSALAAGGHLVPHSAGGLIITAAGGGGYVTSTYLSTAAITSLLAGGIGAIGTGAAIVTGAASTVIGSAGIFGTTVGASGLTGMLMSAGIISATPIWLPIAIGGGLLGFAVGFYKLFKLRRKVYSTPFGSEANFTEAEARAVEKIIRLAARSKRLRDDA